MRLIPRYTQVRCCTGTCTTHSRMHQIGSDETKHKRERLSSVCCTVAFAVYPCSLKGITPLLLPLLPVGATHKESAPMRQDMKATKLCHRPVPLSVAGTMSETRECLSWGKEIRAVAGCQPSQLAKIPINRSRCHGEAASHVSVLKFNVSRNTLMYADCGHINRPAR